MTLLASNRIIHIKLLVKQIALVKSTNWSTIRFWYFESSKKRTIYNYTTILRIVVLSSMYYELRHLVLHIGNRNYYLKQFVDFFINVLFLE